MFAIINSHIENSIYTPLKLIELHSQCFDKYARHFVINIKCDLFKIWYYKMNLIKFSKYSNCQNYNESALFVYNNAFQSTNKKTDA